MQRVLPQVATGDLHLLNATVPACLLARSTPGASDLVRTDLVIEGGKISSISPAGSSSKASETPGLPRHDLDGGLVLPTLVDMHTHLDKGHISPRRPNPDGTFAGALKTVGEDRIAAWTAEDVRARMDFALRSAFVHGTSHIRTHIDSLPPQDEISWPVFCEVRDAWADRITLQGSCLFGVDRLADFPEFLDSIADRVQAAGGVLGAVTYMMPGLDGLLDRIVLAAKTRGLDLDFHVDETKDPEARSFEAIARAVLRNGFDGKVVCGHCCSLAQQPEDEADRTMDLVAQAGIGVVSLPMCNMYLQDRQLGRTPRWRGVTLLHEMKARGIPVAVSSDNTRDPFYAYGDLDLIEVYTQATRILQLDHPVGDWISSVSTQPAEMIGVDAGTLKFGGSADLLLFTVRNWSELLSRPRAAREVLRKGISVTETLPDYRELDPLMIENGARP
ncbi:cytosine deaminase [Roseibium sp. CAU 1637]|uniref:Cytosine deaminase n=1 Tax=Roseibium limicola TaxID=2816037 RepID=A0A939ER35_9HYPH|nr:cytosine deaminase [Roseibium limicola]MBO0347022.1 cytosine deaminase [Roseibium limicola]